MVFTSALGLRIIFALGISIFAWTMLKEWGQEEAWVLIMGGLIICAFALAWPSTLWLTDIGIEQRRWWRPKVVIPWNEVTSIQANRGGDRAVFGRSGNTITFTRYHIDPIGFEFEVRRRANLKETADASAPLTLGLQDYPRVPVGLGGRHKETRRERKLHKDTNDS